MLAVMPDLLDTLPCGILSFASDGTITLANQTVLELLGYQRAEIVGQHVQRVMTVGSRIFYQTHWFPLLRMQGRAEEIFLILRSKTGDEIGVLVNAVRREREGVVAFDCAIMRVRERQRFEDELVRAKRAAEHARAELERQAEELRTSNTHLEEQALELELQQQRLQEQATELEIASEELRAINDELQARNDEAEQLRAMAEEANQAKSAFLAVMSHELRTPLNAIAGYVELLELGIHGPITDEQRTTLGRVARSQRHLLRLINEILNLSRIEAGHVDYQIQPVAVGELISAVRPMIEPQLEQKGITFSVDADAAPCVLADPEKAQQILLNLLGNAVKFTPAGGHVAVVAAGTPDEMGLVPVDVRDTGIGIPAEKLEAVFQPFIQVDASRTRAAEGTGLGLAISRDLARGMGGDIRVRSVLGEGSTFSFALRPVEEHSRKILADSRLGG
jgi:PAS domain S-box-containing protein